MPIFFYLNTPLTFSLTESLKAKIPHIEFVRNQFFRLFDSLNPFFGKFLSDDLNLTAVNISINHKNFKSIQRSIRKSEEDLTYLDLPYMSSINNPWVKAKFSIDGEDYKGKLRLHGNDSIHYRNNQKSLAVKLSKEKLYKNMRRFSLIITQEASIASMLSYKVQEILYGFKVHTEFIRLSINGVNQGIFFIEEKLSKELLEKNGMSGVDVVRPLDEWNHQYQSLHLTPYNWSAANTKVRSFSKKDIGQLFLYKKIYETDDINFIKSKINLNETSKTEALRFLFGNNESGDNQKLLYTTFNGRFSRFFRPENQIRPLPISSNSSINSWIYRVEDKISKNNLFIRLIRNNKFREMRDKELWKILLSELKIIKLSNEIFNNFKDTILKDSNTYTSSKSIIYNELNKISVLHENFRKIRKYLSTNFSITKINNQEGEEYFSFKNLSNVPLTIINGAYEETVHINLDDNLNAIKSEILISRKELGSKNRESSGTHFKIINTITGEELDYEI